MITPSRILEELLRYRRASSEETQRLANINHDELCKRVEAQINFLLHSFRKYQSISYFVQGPRDQGVDVVLKESKDDEPDSYHAFQIKSYLELNDKDNNLSQKLKSGIFDARDRYGEQLKRYNILLFGDAIKHEKRLAAITNEFARDRLARVFGPRDLVTFLGLPSNKIFAIVDRHLGEEDHVRKTARHEVAGHSQAELYFILATLSFCFERSNDVLPSDFFSTNAGIRDCVALFGEETLHNTIDRFADNDFEERVQPHSTRIRTELYAATRALYFDFKVRYDEEPAEIFAHLLEFFRDPDESPLSETTGDQG